MARIFTTTDAENAAKIFMHDITVAGGINTKNLRTTTPYSFGRSDYITAAQTICNELVARDFADIDPAIHRAANFYFKANYDGSGKNKSLKPEGVAKAIVYLAERLQLYWDDTIRTPYEVEEFKKTLLGNAVYKYGRYISALNNTKGTRTSTAKTPGQPPKNNYKQSGPQSGNVRDLQDLNGGPGTPGAKVHGSSGLMFKIIGDNPQSKNTPNVFVKPLSSAGAHGTTNKIFFSSGNGYTDCTCYFDDPNEAQAFLDKIIADNRIPSNVTNARVVKVKEDSNGYFLVGTEYGRCAISAKTLNEALAEALNEETAGWEKATEGYSKKELDELHTWMRRG